MESEISYAEFLPLFEKQKQALEVIANKKGCFAPQTLDHIIESLPYKVTKQAFQFTLRSLIKRGLARKLDRQCVDGKSRRFIQITMLGLHKLESSRFDYEKAADKKVCMVDEIAVTDRLLKEISEKFQE